MNDGKKRTWKQWKALEEKKALTSSETHENVQYGRCSCGAGSFRHRVEQRELVRICKSCGEEKVV